MSQETIAETEFASLRREIRPALATLAEKLLSDLGDNLRSLTVVGSAVTDDFHPQRSDINTVLLVARRSHELLHTIAGYGKTMGKLKLRAPLLMTDEYLQSSRDSFAVELLDFQLNHTTIIGPDPFAGLTFKKEDVRLQGERELKAALIKLRQGYISRLGRGKLIGQLLIDLTLVRHRKISQVDAFRGFREHRPHQVPIKLLSYKGSKWSQQLR